jgi:HAE1 family hydrophobic/amphiphilic exporter-1
MLQQIILDLMENMIKSVIIPLERALNGVPGMKYMTSDAGNDGEARLYLT